jgi:hypothetical protein
MIDSKFPIMKEKNPTLNIIHNNENILSSVFVDLMSPHPTVVKVW